MTDPRSAEAQVAYPTSLLERERERWNLGLRARYGNETPPDKPQIGVALSGGGIRSATFSLGVFQAFAGRGFLKHIDFLSTISGGGYFGAFFGALFARPYVKSPGDVASVLLETPPDATTGPELNQARERVIPWLREHGRYLSPRGAGDQLLFLTVLFRNWLALNVVIALPLITVALAMQSARYWDWFNNLAPNGATMWWSPWIGAAILPFAVIPSLIWAYFLRDDRARFVIVSLATSFVVAAFVVVSYRFGPGWGWTFAVTSKVALTAAIAMFVVVGLAILFHWMSGEDQARSGNHLAQWLRAALGAVVMLAFAGLLDSLGQTVYYHVTHGSLGGWIASLAAGLGGIAAFARQITVLLGPKASGDRAGLPLSIVASIVAAVLIVVLGTAYSTAAHAIAWNFQPPSWTVESTSRTHQMSLLGWFFAFAVLSWGFGQKWRFVNYSTHQPLYSARLARAYLGASNPERWKDGNLSVLEPQKGDDFAMAEYWPGLETGGNDRFRKGAPQHLMSVTINATVGGRSQIEQRDRKGLGLAVGPAGLSVGVRHHAVLSEKNDKDGRRLVLSPDRGGFNALSYSRENIPEPFKGEPLKLSMWTGLSGAAFSTGVGSRTSLGLSLITGFLNVRLGYWWQSGSVPPPSAPSSSNLRIVGRLIGGAFQKALPVHRYLADEFLARFPGVSRPRWYLSDGGHFENLGAYELVRRRVPLAILVDGGEDAGAAFDDLGNLVRKARTDFDAEINFLTPAQLESVKRALGVKGTWAIGTLDDLRPVKKGTERPYSKAYATLATVTYESTSPCSDDGLETTLLVYVKPSLLNDEEAIDLINFGRQRPAFPHESTADQFFDEAQWESYRKLGEAIVCRVWRDLGLDRPSDFIRSFRQEAESWKES